jgi:ATP-dependent Clp protease ATP-binding subunit ClpX
VCFFAKDVPTRAIGGVEGPPMKHPRPDPQRIPSPREIFEHLEKYVVGQRRAKRALALASYTHLRRLQLRRAGRPSLLRKSNVLLIGPTGSGKTLLARHLAGVLEAPLATADATEFTEAGYYGKDVELMISDLFTRAGHVVEEAQRGLVFIDEVDKIARRSQGAANGAGARDIGGEGVQQGLLKLLEGREVLVPIHPGQPWARGETATVDTTEILFICAGTFTDLYPDLCTERRVGFGATPRPQHVDERERRRSVRTEDLVSYGMLTEFLGRLPIVVELDELGADDLLRVLTEPADSLLREFRERLEMEGIELVVRASALREMVEQALSRKVGARGLRAIFEEVCSDLLFEAPERAGRRAVIDAGFVKRRLAATLAR